MKKLLILSLIATLTGCGINPRADSIAQCAFLSVGSLGLVAPLCIKEHNKRFPDTETKKAEQ